MTTWIVEYFDDDGWMIYTEDGQPLPPTPHNIILIAAAPQLLEVLQRALRTYETMTSHDFALGKDKPMRDAMRAAIATVEEA